MIEFLEEEKEFIDAIIENVRTASHDLSPHFLFNFGLVKALSNFVLNIDNPKISIRREDSLNLNNITTINVYRIALELINNIIKHDSSGSMQINIIGNEKEIFMTIEHNGIGISNEQFNIFAQNTQGMGLTSIQSRIIILNTNLDFSLSKDEPKVKLLIPTE